MRDRDMIFTVYRVQYSSICWQFSIIAPPEQQSQKIIITPKCICVAAVNRLPAEYEYSRSPTNPANLNTNPIIRGGAAAAPRSLRGANEGRSREEEKRSEAMS